MATKIKIAPGIKFKRGKYVKASSFTSTDGAIHPDERTAEKSQVKIDFIKWYNGPTGKPIKNPSAATMHDWIAANEMTVRQILGET